MDETKENKFESIFLRLIRINREIGAVNKNNRNKEQGFLYRSIEDLMNEIHPAFARNGVIIIPECGDHSREIVGKTAKGAPVIHHFIRVRFSFVSEVGESYETKWVIGEVKETGDKGVGKAVSYALKKTLEVMFTLPTKDDADEHTIEHIGVENEKKIGPQTGYTVETKAKLVSLACDKFAYEPQDANASLEDARAFFVKEGLMEPDSKFSDYGEAKLGDMIFMLEGKTK